MNLAFVLRVTSILLIIVCIFMGLSIPVALAYGEVGLIPAFLVPMGASLLFFFVIASATRRSSWRALSIRDSYLFVTLGWLAASAMGALPFVVSGSIPNYVDAFFETMSGFSTTGASILTDIEALPRSILFWRSMTHWLGGMGIVVLTVAIFPLLGIGGVRLMDAEAPGPSVDRITPRLTGTAKILWSIYVLLTVLEIALLLAGGMSLFDAATHTFGTMATGGFSPRNASVGYYRSVYVDTVITMFMVLAGINFTLYFRLAVLRWREVLHDGELRAYLTILAGAILLITVNLVGTAGYSVGKGLRYASFQAASFLTTTGFATADFAAWPAFAQIVMFVLMFIGGCAGSTGGGIKVVRIVMLLKQAITEMRYQLFPRGVFPVHLGGRAVRKNVIYSVYAFVFLYLLSLFAVTAVVASGGYDILSSLTASLACLGNIGPGFGLVGPTANYAHFPQYIKVVLSLAMMTGRLEVYTVLLLLYPSFWKR